MEASDSKSARGSSPTSRQLLKQTAELHLESITPLHGNLCPATPVARWICTMFKLLPTWGKWAKGLRVSLLRLVVFVKNDIDFPAPADSPWFLGRAGTGGLQASQLQRCQLSAIDLQSRHAQRSAI